MSRGGNTVLQHIEIRRYMHGRWGLATLGVELVSDEADKATRYEPSIKRARQIICDG